MALKWRNIYFDACIIFKVTSPYEKKYLCHDMIKPTKWVCAQRRLRSAWAFATSDESSLCVQWKTKDPRLFHADSDSDQTGPMPRLIWVFAGRTVILLVLSCRSSDVLHWSFWHWQQHPVYCCVCFNMTWRRNLAFSIFVFIHPFMCPSTSAPSVQPRCQVHYS